MPRAPPALLRGLGRGLRPAVKPLAYGLAASTALYGASVVVRRVGEARNPPLQYRTVDPDPYRVGDESTLAFDPRTGRTLTFGAAPTDKGDNERSEERTTNLLIWGGLAAIAAIVVLGA